MQIYTLYTINKYKRNIVEINQEIIFFNNILIMKVMTSLWKITIFLCLANSQYLLALDAKWEQLKVLSTPSILTKTKFTKDASNNAYYVGSDQKIYKINLIGPNYTTTCITDLLVQGCSLVKSGSDLLWGNANQLFFIGSNNRLMNYYMSGGQWYCNEISSTLPNAADGTGISLDQFGRIFFIGTNNLIYQCYWTGTKWQYYTLPNPIKAPKANSDLLTPSGKVYYIGTDSKIYNYYWNGTSWLQAILNSSAPLAENGTNLEYYDVGKLFYVEATGRRIISLTFQGGAWVSNVEFQNSTALPYSSPRVQLNQNRVFYVDASSRLSFLYKVSGTTYNSAVLDVNSNYIYVKKSNWPDILITNNGDLIFNDSSGNNLKIIRQSIIWERTTEQSGLTCVDLDANCNSLTCQQTALYTYKRPLENQFYPRNANNIGTIVLRASNLIGLSNVQFYLEKVPFSGNTTTTSYSFAINTDGIVNGNIVLAP